VQHCPIQSQWRESNSTRAKIKTKSAVCCVMCGVCILGYGRIHQRSIYTLKQNNKPESLLAMAATAAWKKITGREMVI
jgi:hypothetical protein